MFDAKQFLSQVSSKPGVYQMLDEQGKIIYVGKAKHLKHRLSSYFSGQQHSVKTAALVKQIHDIQVTITQSEYEALILECNLIKEHRPKYNVLMRDDKSYPYIRFSTDDTYPRMDYYRGRRHQHAKFFGPYPSADVVKETIKLLQKIFCLRSCSAHFYAQRTRPCLQYQIQRCSAPCVGYITPEAYAHNVERAQLFLQGKSQAVMADLAKQMESAAQALDFEKAAYYRDLIGKLQQAQAKQSVLNDKGDADVLGLVYEGGVACIGHLVIREGRMVASQCYSPKVPSGSSSEEILGAFLGQHYLMNEPSFGMPKEIISNIAFAEKALFEQNAKLPVKLKAESHPWLAMAMKNARERLLHDQYEQVKQEEKMRALQLRLGLSSIQRMECFDISHTQGEATVGVCVVFDERGPLKAYYRRYNMLADTHGDDYAAMRETLMRRYKKATELPDVIVIDGGKGQLSVARSVMEALGFPNACLVGVAKGVTRKPGLETLWINGCESSWAFDDPALHIIQQIRDESHRFAITGHRARREKARTTSTLENIPGIGATRRRELLRHFGGLQGVLAAGVEDLQRAPGISRGLAEKIYHHLHEG